MNFAKLLLFFVVIPFRLFAYDESVYIAPGEYSTPYVQDFKARITTGFLMSKNLITSSEWKKFMKDKDETISRSTFHEYFEGDDVDILKSTFDRILEYGNFPMPIYNFLKMLEFCNWKSSRDKLKSVYKIVNTGKTVLYKNGKYPLVTIVVSPNANGYRLPTLSEYIAALSLGKDYEDHENLQPDLSRIEDVSFYRSTDYGIFDDSDNVSRLKFYEIGLTNPDRIGIYDLAGAIPEIVFDVKEHSYKNYGSTDLAINNFDDRGNPQFLTCVMSSGALAEEIPIFYSNPEIGPKSAFSMLFQSSRIPLGFRLCRNAK